MDVGAHWEVPSLESHEISLRREGPAKAFEGISRFFKVAVPGPDLDEPSSFAEREGDVKAARRRALYQDSVCIDLCFRILRDESERFLDHPVEARQIRGVLFHSLAHSIFGPLSGAGAGKGVR